MILEFYHDFGISSRIIIKIEYLCDGNSFLRFLYLIKRLRIRYYHRIVLYSNCLFIHYVTLFYEIILHFRNYTTRLSR